MTPIVATSDIANRCVPLDLKRRNELLIEMKTISNQIFILIASLILSSCDPGQKLIFVNETDSNVSIKIIEVGCSTESIKSNIRTEYNVEIVDTTLINLGTGRTKSDTIHFGLGTWEIHNRLDSFLINLKEVTFISKIDTISINSINRLDSLFRSSLSGKFNESIVIRID